MSGGCCAICIASGRFAQKNKLNSVSFVCELSDDSLPPEEDNILWELQLTRP